MVLLALVALKQTADEHWVVLLEELEQRTGETGVGQEGVPR